MYMYMQEIIQQLEERHIPYTLREHPPVYTMEALKTMADMPHAAYICKNLLVRNAKKTSYYIVCMSQGKKIPLKKLGMQIANTRFSLASSEEMKAYLQCRPGSVSPLVYRTHSKRNFLPGVIYDNKNCSSGRIEAAIVVRGSAGRFFLMICISPI